MIRSLLLVLVQLLEARPPSLALVNMHEFSPSLDVLGCCDDEAVLGEVSATSEANREKG